MLNDLLTINTTTINGVIKLGTLIALLVYIIFAFIIIRQIETMNTTINVPLARLLRVLAFVHFIVAASLFALVFFFA